MMRDSGIATSEVLLERLRDIHPAAEPSWWPPAVGWWVLGVVALAAVIYLSIRVVRRIRVQLRRRRLVRQLDALADACDPVAQPADYLAAVNRVFRVIALRAFPETDCARLHGVAWVDFIRERLPGEDNPACLEALETGPYRPRPDFDPEALHAQARRWVVNYG